MQNRPTPAAALDDLLKQPVERMIALVAELPRETAKRCLLEFAPLRLDFTEAYLDGLAPERLKHVLLAALMQARRRASRTLAA